MVFVILSVWIMIFSFRRVFGTARNLNIPLKLEYRETYKKKRSFILLKKAAKPVETDFSFLLAYKLKEYLQSQLKLLMIQVQACSPLLLQVSEFWLGSDKDNHSLKYGVDISCKMNKVIKEKIWLEMLIDVIFCFHG